jgi:hypothetical protein
LKREMGRGLEYWELLSQLKTFFLEKTFGEKEAWKGIKAEFKKNCKT